MRIKQFLSAIEIFTDQSGKFIALIVLIIVGTTVYEVAARFIFHSPTIWGHESAELIFGIYVILTGGYAVLHEQHIRVDVFWARFSPRGRAIADLATSVFTFIFVVTLFWFSIPFAWHSIQIHEKLVGSYWAPPIYPSKIFLVLGLFWLLLLLIVKFVRDIYAVKSGVQELGVKIKGEKELLPK
jgi:TRAP-type mannitol/chloroaromatic compound transport system permease small subunit